MSRWYKRSGMDFIHGTMMLTLEEKGAYSLCLDLIYDRGGPIPDDARWLAGVCGVSLRKWSALRQRLLDLGKLTTSGGMLMNVRAASEIASAELQVKKLAESGAKGGRKRAENEAKAKENSHLGQAGLKLKEEIRIDKSSVAEATGAEAPNNPSPIDLKAAVLASGVPLLTRSGLADRNARSMLGRWRQTFGDGPVMDALSAAQAEAPSDIVPWINRYLETRNGQRTGRRSGWINA